MSADFHRGRTAIGRRARQAAIVAGYLLAFAALDRTTISLQLWPGVVAWYPPDGLSFAFLLVFGAAYAPAFWVASVISSTLTYRLPIESSMLLTWSTLLAGGYALAAALLRTVIRIDLELRRLRDVTWFVLIALGLALVLASLSVTGSATSGVIPWSRFGAALFAWWIGEVIGILILTPPLLVFGARWATRLAGGVSSSGAGAPGDRPAFSLPSLLEIGAESTAIAVMLWAVFGMRAGREFQLFYLCFLPLIWIALRHGSRGASLAIPAINAGAMLVIRAAGVELAGLPHLQLLMLVLALTGLFLGAAVSERRQAEEEVRRINADLDRRVADRTAQLESSNLQLGLAREEADQARADLERQNQRLEDEVSERTERLLQSEKLAAMGSLLAGVAHELNNPLAVVIGRVALLRKAIGTGPLGEPARKIAEAAERCARIVRNFLELARQRPPDRERVSLNHVAAEALELLAYPLRVDGVEVTRDLQHDLPTLWADPHQLHQVVVNLVTNARQAMHQAPARRLTLATRHDPAASQAVLTVSDTGPGIPPEIKARIFDPFFTTKPAGEGTGLGLSLCRGIIEGHGGTLEVESHPGRGAVFSIRLPLAGQPGVQPEDPGRHAPAGAGTGTILVVDDEAEVADMVTEMLAADGHRVDRAANGIAALDRIRERPYDLVLSDLRMPDLDGPGLYRAIESHHPDLLPKLCFMTGDTLSAENEKFLETAGVPVLGKPFTLEDLRRTVRQALGGDTSNAR